MATIASLTFPAIGLILILVGIIKKYWDKLRQYSEQLAATMTSAWHPSGECLNQNSAQDVSEVTYKRYCDLDVDVPEEKAHSVYFIEDRVILI